MTHHQSHQTAARAAAAGRSTLAATVVGVVLLHGVSAPALAGPLADPTRPPAALQAPGGLAAAALPHQANRDTARAIAAAQRAADPPPPPAPVVVQAVQLPAAGSMPGVAMALVDGRPVKAGEQIDGRNVLVIDAQGLLVKGAKGPERLWLLVGTAKQAAGSITHSQTARYQAPAGTPGMAAGTTAGTDNQAANTPAERGNTASLSANPGNTSAATTPLSLARRTAP